MQMHSRVNKSTTNAYNHLDAFQIVNIYPKQEKKR